MSDIDLSQNASKIHRENLTGMSKINHAINCFEKGCDLIEGINHKNQSYALTVALELTTDAILQLIQYRQITEIKND